MPENIGFECELDNVNTGENEEITQKNNGNKKNYNTIQPDTQNTKSSGWITRKSRDQCGCGNNLVIVIIGAVILIALIWLLLYTLFGVEVNTHGGLFKILSLTITSFVVGRLVAIIHLPPLLGMLVTGIVFRTSGFYHINETYQEIVIVLREAALCTILVRAGLGLDADALLKLSLVVLRLALLPCIGESLATATASHFILGFPWLWGLLLGFLLSAVSPAVVVPSLLSLKERGYGEDKGISTLVIGASSLDDITAISVFGICLGMVFSQGDVTDQIIQGPKELVLGLGSGIAWGLLSSFIPNVKDNMVVFKRSLMVGVWGLLAVIGSQKIGCPGAGPLSCIVSSLTASIFWKLQGWSSHNPVADVFGVLWSIMQPILFGLIGAEIDLNQLQLGTIANGVAVILCGLGFRVITCLIAVLGTELNVKERFFVNLAWIPKATVQAALASKALDTVREQMSPNDVDLERGAQVLTIAVLSILITAPIGAVGVAVGGPLLLSNKNSPKRNQNEHDDPS